MKTAYIALIRDIKKGITHLEAFPHLFDSEESILYYAEQRFNILVTVVVSISTIQVEDEVELLNWSPAKERKFYKESK